MAALATILENSQASLSFWGSKLVIANGYEGSAYLGDISSKYLELAGGDALSLQDRTGGLQIHARLHRYYEQTDALEWQTSIITLIIAVFNKIISCINRYCCDICVPLYTARWFIMSDNSSVYQLLAFTPDQFRSTFPNEELPASRRFESNGITFHIERQEPA